MPQHYADVRIFEANRHNLPTSIEPPPAHRAPMNLSSTPGPAPYPQPTELPASLHPLLLEQQRDHHHRGHRSRVPELREPKREPHDPQYRDREPLDHGLQHREVDRPPQEHVAPHREVKRQPQEHVAQHRAAERQTPENPHNQQREGERHPENYAVQHRAVERQTPENPQNQQREVAQCPLNPSDAHPQREKREPQDEDAQNAHMQLVRAAAAELGKFTNTISWIKYEMSSH